jgi:hypothetical protein
LHGFWSLSFLLGWEPGPQEGSIEWEEDWDKFEDEGLHTFITFDAVILHFILMRPCRVLLFNIIMAILPINSTSTTTPNKTF